MGALQGSCPFRQCKLDHSGEGITDKMAEAAVELFHPFLQDPNIYKDPGK